MSSPGSESAIEALFNAPDIAAARDILRLYPHLIDGTVSNVLRAVAADLPDRAARERVGRTADLIRGALTSGLDQAFETMSAAPPAAPSAFELMKIGTQFLREPDDRLALALLREYPDIPADLIRTMAESSLRYEAPEDRVRIERRLQLLDRMSAVSRMAAAMARAQAAEAELSAHPSIERLREAARASDDVVASVAESEVPEAARASLFGHTATLYLSIWANVFDPDALDRAIDLCRMAEELQPGGVLEPLAAALVNRYESRATAADLDEAITRLEAAIPGDVVSERDQSSAPLATTFANALRHRAILTGDGDRRDIDRAVALYEVLAGIETTEELRKQIRRLNLSSGLMSRYDTVGDLVDLDRAIGLMQDLFDVLPDDALPKATVANNLGLALLKRFSTTRDGESLKKAASTARASVELLKPGAPETARNLTNCGGCFLVVYRETRDRAWLDAAAGILLDALEPLRDTAPEASRAWGLAAETLIERFKLSPSRQDIDRAIECTKRALEATRQEGGLYFGALGQLAQALRTRSGSAFAAPDDLAEGLRIFRQAATAALPGTPMLALEQALQWGAWAGDRGDWPQAADAHLLAMDAHARVLDSQQDRLTRELRLKRVQGLGALAASALIRAGRPRDALLALERGRGLLAAQALQRRPEDVSFETIVEKAGGIPLVYLEDVDGGFALVVRDGNVSVVDLPDLREEKVNGWLKSYADLRLEQPEAWSDRLLDFCRWLWDVAMGPLIAALPDARRMTLVPGGLLGMLPLHAAWKDDPNAPTGRFHAADALAIQYAPSAYALHLDAAPAFRSILAVDEPSPVTAPALKFSQAEIAAAVGRFDRQTVVGGADATRDRVLAAIGGHDVLHFSCHGTANLSQPLDNGLLLSNDVLLTLRDFLDVTLDGVTLAVLSACDTGQIGTTLPDEAIGLPTGLLQAGVRGVVSPLWLIGGFTTLLLLARFYERLLQDRVPPAEALGSAQRWVRDTDNAEKSRHFASVPALHRPLMLRDPQARDNASIGEWAAFTYVGV